MAQQSQTEVDSIEALTEGDTVHVTGNGADFTGTVSALEHSSHKDKDVARVVADGFTATLTDTDHRLMSDGIRSNVGGAVTVTLA